MVFECNMCFLYSRVGLKQKRTENKTNERHNQHAMHLHTQLVRVTDPNSQ